MSLKSLSTLTIVAVLCLPVAAIAQEQQEEQTFRLLRDSASAEKELELEEQLPTWTPRIDQGTIEVSVALGFLNLNTTLLKHDQIIYKYTQENSYFGDVTIKGESAFNPMLRLGFNWSRWFALEGVGGLSFSEYTSTIENRKSQKNEPGAPVISDPPLGDYDAEQRSLLTGQAALNAVIYPLNIARRINSRFHPYLTAGVEHFWYNMNSNYTNETATAFGGNVGGGIRVLADENISVRFEVLLHMNKLDWTPATYFTERNEGTVRVPLEAWPDDGVRDRVTDFEANDMILLNWSVGIQGSF
jgi:opacity protein-like surface antigen